MVKRILITGANGFIGSYLVNHLSIDEFDIHYISRKDIELTSKKRVNDYFKKMGKFDALIHCAGKGGRRIEKDTEKVLIENLIMFENLCNNAEYFETIINIGSGAEYDYDTGDIYALSKYIIAKAVRYFENGYNVRVFGCFGKDEEPQRFITTCINNILSNEPVRIFVDKEMDFIFIEDLKRIIEYILIKKPKQKDIDAVYKEKMNLSEIAEQIKKMMHSDCEIIIDNTSLEPYTGDAATLLSFGIDLCGFDYGLNCMINHIKGKA